MQQTRVLKYLKDLFFPACSDMVLPTQTGPVLIATDLLYIIVCFLFLSSFQRNPRSKIQSLGLLQKLKTGECLVSNVKHGLIFTARFAYTHI